MKSLATLFAFTLLSTSAPAAITLEVDDSALAGATPESPVTGTLDSPAKAAIEAFNRGRHIEGVRLATPLAAAGNADALLILGLAYETGSGVEASREVAIENYRKAHKAGSTEATTRLARLLASAGEKTEQKEAWELLKQLSEKDTGTAALLLGDGLLRGSFGDEPDFEKARFWWSRAAEQGDVSALIALGRLLDGDFGFPKQRDPAAALSQFLKAAELGDASAMLAAGSRLLSGEEKLRDEALGREWLAKAIAKDELNVYIALGNFEEAIKKDDSAALAEFTKGAEAGQSDCMLKVAAFHLEGRGGLPKSAEEALVWYKKAGEAGNAVGHVQAAAALLKGEGLQIVEGYAHLLAAAESGPADVQNELGLFYLSGRLGLRDASAAAAWFSRSASAGYPQSAYNLGALYEQGVGVPKSFAQAGKHYVQAANAGHPQATTALGRLNAAGAGTKQNLPQAWALFSLAMERGDKDAAAPLGELTSQISPEQVEEGRSILAGFKEDKKSPPEEIPAPTSPPKAE